MLQRLIDGINNFVEDDKLIKICFYSIFSTILFAVFILNFHTPLIADDFAYAFSYYDGSRVNSFADIIKSMQAHYFKWGGRIVVHAIAQFFLMFDKIVFNIANTIVYGLFVAIIYANAIPDFKLSSSSLIGINLVLFMLLPAFGQDILWLVGSCNYLWGPTLVLANLYIFRRRYYLGKEVIKTKFDILLLFLLGLISAWTNENMAVALVCGVTVLCYMTYKRDGKIYRWQLTGLMGCLLGAGALILSPGNFARASLFPPIDIISNFLHISCFWLQKDFLFIPCVIVALLFVLVKDKKETCLETIPYFVCLLASLYSMICVPFYADRCKITNLVFIIIIALIEYKHVNLQSTKSRIYVTTFVVISVLAMVKTYKVALMDIRMYESKCNTVLGTVYAEKIKGNLDVVVSSKYPYTKYCAVAGLEELDKNAEHWINKSFAKYYGIRSIRAIDE